MVCIQRMGILCFCLMFGVGFLVEVVPINQTNGLGFELLLAKLDYMEYKFLELQVEVKEQGEQLLSSQEKIKQDLLEQSRQILEQQKFFANHEAFKQTIFELRPRKHPSDNSWLVERFLSSQSEKSSPLIASCQEEVSKRSGRYRMNVTGSDPFDVYCEQQFYGGGWIVIQNRFNGSVEFNRSWVEFRDGFGSIDGEFWLGLEKIRVLTQSKPRELLVHVEDHSGNVKYARYGSFAVGSEGEKYVLKTLDRHSGTLGDSLREHRGQRFSTFDSDNDTHKTVNCALNSGGWWFFACLESNLNGLYKNVDSTDTMNWQLFSNNFQGLKISKMMLK